MSKSRFVLSASLSSFQGPLATMPPRTPGSLCAQASRFLACGGAATCMHWAAMALLLVCGAPPLPATVAGAVIGSAFNYLLQRHWVFVATAAHRKALPAYAGTVALGWSLNAAGFWLLASFFHLDAPVAQVCTSALVAVVNFVLYKKVVFHERSV